MRPNVHSLRTREGPPRDVSHHHPHHRHRPRAAGQPARDRGDHLARCSGDTFDVAPGERLTVVYEMDDVGTWVWHCHILSHLKRSDGSMFGMLTAVIVTEREG